MLIIQHLRKSHVNNVNMYCVHTLCLFLSSANKFICMFIDMSSINVDFVLSASNSKRCAARISALSSRSPLAQKSRGVAFDKQNLVTHDKSTHIIAF